MAVSREARDMHLLLRGPMTRVMTHVRRGVVGMCAVIAAGCGHDSTGPSARPLYWRVQLNHHAVTLATVAPYDTIRLTTTPLDETGAPTVLTAKAVYTRSDTSITIDSTGLVRVHWAGSDAPTVQVIATVSTVGTQGVTHADTVYINVVNWSTASAVPVLDSLLFRPVAGDSAVRAVIDLMGAAGTQTFDDAIAKTAEGVMIPNVLVRYRSSDSLIAGFTNPASTTAAPQLIANKPGVVLLTADATVYGKHKIDSLWYTVGYPLRTIFVYGVGDHPSTRVPLPANTLSTGTLQVGLGGAVLWGNTTVGKADDSLDIQFDRTTGIAGVTAPILFPAPFGTFTAVAGAGGNIAAFPAAVPIFLFTDGSGSYEQILYDTSTSRARVFMQPGTYHWSSQHQGITGTVTVIPNDSIPRK